MSSSVWSANAKFVDGELNIAGKSATDLAREFGTPLYVLDEADFKARALAFKESLDSAFDSSIVYYASKAFLCKEIVRWLDQLGLGIDVATGGELEVALSVNFPVDRILVHGNNKSIAEIDRAVSAKVGVIVIDYTGDFTSCGCCQKAQSAPESNDSLKARRRGAHN